MFARIIAAVLVIGFFATSAYAVTTKQFLDQVFFVEVQKSSKIVPERKAVALALMWTLTEKVQNSLLLNKEQKETVLLLLPEAFKKVDISLITIKELEAEGSFNQKQLQEALSFLTMASLIGEGDF